MKPRRLEFTVTGKLIIFDMPAPWIYVLVPDDKVPDVRPGGWGSVKIDVTLGSSKWRTSMFPLKNKGYFMPIKKPILKKENLKVGDLVSIKYTAV